MLFLFFLILTVLFSQQQQSINQLAVGLSGTPSPCSTGYSPFVTAQGTSFSYQGNPIRFFGGSIYFGPYSASDTRTKIDQKLALAQQGKFNLIRAVNFLDGVS